MKSTLRPVPGRGSRAGLSLSKGVLCIGAGSGGALRGGRLVVPGLAMPVPPSECILASDQRPIAYLERREPAGSDLGIDRRATDAEVLGEPFDRVGRSEVD